jgi:hypothetical protein
MSSEDSLEQKLFRYILDLENIPLSIHRIWKDFNQKKDLDKQTFIRIFHQIPKTYSSFRIVYHHGCPYILNTKKGLWEITQNEYKVTDNTICDRITNSDILRYYIDHKDEVDFEIPNNFVVKIIEEGKSSNLKMILDDFDFTDEDFDEFLKVANEKRCSFGSKYNSLDTFNDPYIDILIDLMGAKYEMIQNQLAFKNYELEHSNRQLESKYNDLNFYLKILKENEREAKLIKTTFFYSLLICIIYNLYSYI